MAPEYKVVRNFASFLRFTTLCVVLFSLQMTSNVSRGANLKERFSLASNRKIMSGILLTQGPVSIHKSVKNLSPAFKVGLSKAKFLTAANHLVQANLGTLIVLDAISRTSHVFIKKPPAEVKGILELKENQDLCSIEDYESRFHMVTSYCITPAMKQHLVTGGLVSEELLRPMSSSDTSSNFPTLGNASCKLEQNKILDHNRN